MPAAMTAPGGRAQTVLGSTDRGAIVGVDSAYDVVAENRDRDVVVTASYCGVLPARFVAAQRPRGVIGVDCGVGKDGAGIAGLWYYEALGVAAATVDVRTVRLGDGVDVHAHGVISFVNEPARAIGVEVGLSADEAARRMLAAQRVPAARAAEITNRTVVWSGGGSGAIVCTDSIAFGLPEDRDANVLCTAGHTGRSAAPYLERVHPRGFICSDGGGGRDGSGRAGLAIVDRLGLAGATVDAATARMGDGLSTYHDGVISACNASASERGVRVGQPAREAAMALLVRS